MKNLLQTIILVLALCVMNQFADAQTFCGHGYGYCVYGYCQCNNSGRHCKCVQVCCPLRPGEQEVLNYETSLTDIYPNPVSNSTTIEFSLQQKGRVSLNIFDISGRLVTTLTEAIFEKGDNDFVWNIIDLNAGIYFLRMEAEDYSKTERLSVVK